MLRPQPSPLRAPLLYLLIGTVAGLLAAHYGPSVTPLALSVLAAMPALLAYRYSSSGRVWTLSFLTASFLTIWAYGLLRLPPQPSDALLALPPREAVLSLEIDQVFRAHDTYGKSSGIAHVVAAPQLSRLKAKQAIYFRVETPEAMPLQMLRGMQFQAKGVLYPIGNSSTDGFERFLNRSGVQYRFEKAVVLRPLKPPSRFTLFCARMKDRLQSYLRRGAPAHAEVDTIYLAMLLGHKAELSPEQRERYQMTGTMHLFAISGLHIGVIATVIAQFLNLIRIPRRLNPWIGLPFLYLYVEITGASPSAVRAFLMAAFFWASFALQRQRNPVAALVGSALFVLLIQPTQLWSIGFQLSYTVVLSILIFGLPLQVVLREQWQPFRWLPKDSWRWWQHSCAWGIHTLVLLASISLAAWLASAPLSASLFGYFAPGAVLLNMLLVNLAALVICTGVISFACAFVLPSLVSTFINHAAWLVLSVMDAMIVKFTQLPGAILESPTFPIQYSYALLACYFAILFWVHYRQRSLSHWHLLSAPITLIVLLIAGLCVF